MDSTDQLRIDTPEQIALELPLAGIGSRFLALAIDTIVQAGLYLIVALVFVIVIPAGSFFTVIPTTLGPAVAIFLVFAIYWGYFAFFEAIWKGQTPGKRFVGIRVIKESGRPISVLESVGRNLMRAVDALPGFYGVGMVCMLCNRQSRRLGDYVAGTVVVHEKPPEDFRPNWGVSERTDETAVVPTNVTPEELVLIETYLHRRWELDKYVRMNTAFQIADRVKATTGLSRQPNQDIDDFLEEAARKLRDGGHFR